MWVFADFCFSSKGRIICCCFEAHFCCVHQQSDIELKGIEIIYFYFEEQKALHKGKKLDPETIGAESGREEEEDGEEWRQRTAQEFGLGGCCSVYLVRERKRGF